MDTALQTTTILLLEDNPGDARLIREMLRTARAGAFRLETANRLADGLARIVSGEIDVLLLDLSLPDSQGLSTLVRIQAEAPGLPVVVLTGFDDSSLGLKALQAGAQDYLVKGQVDANLLARSLDYAIERKRAEATHSMFAAIVEASDDAIIGIDLGARILTWNGGAERLYGFPAAEIKGQPISILVAPDHVMDFAQILDSVWKGERIQEEAPHVRKSGSRVDVSLTVSPMKGPSGNVIGASVIVHNITQRKQIESELNNYRTHLEQLVAQRTVELLDVNQTLQQEIGERKRVEAELEYRAQLEKLITALSAHFINLSPGEIDAGITHALRAVGEVAGIDRSFIFQFSADGAYLNYTHEWCAPSIESQIPTTPPLPVAIIPWWMEKLRRFENICVPSIPALPPDAVVPEVGFWRRGLRSMLVIPMVYAGSLLGVLGIESIRKKQTWQPDVISLFRIVAELFVNALERKRAEQALYRSEEQLRQITDNMLDIICQTDADGIIRYVSSSCWELLGYTPEVLIGHSIYAWVHPDDVVRVMDDIQKIGRSEYRYQRIGGDYVWLESLISYIFSDGGQSKSIIFASRDITERKRAEKELQELNQLKTEFLSTAAHELRTPLTSIRGFSELLLTRKLDTPRQQHYLELINEQSRQLGQIIDALLDVSRLESKRNFTLTLESLDLAALVKKTVLPFSEISPHHSIQIQGVTACPNVRGDASKLTQVIQNLLSNAIKYSPQGGQITVCCCVADNFVQVSIGDQGIGMTPDEQLRLFERFYRVNASNTSTSGTGLGLSICKALVELHSGKIWIESAPGVGTTAHFTIPIAD